MDHELNLLENGWHEIFEMLGMQLKDEHNKESRNFIDAEKSRKPENRSETRFL